MLLDITQFQKIIDAGKISDLENILMTLEVTNVSVMIEGKNPYTGSYESNGNNVNLTFNTANISDDYAPLIGLVTNIITRFEYLQNLLVNGLINQSTFKEQRKLSKDMFEKLFLNYIKRLGL